MANIFGNAWHDCIGNDHWLFSVQTSTQINKVISEKEENIMQEFELVHYWMLGVMGVMLVFFLAAVLGYYYGPGRNKK